MFQRSVLFLFQSSLNYCQILSLDVPFFVLVPLIRRSFLSTGSPLYLTFRDFTSSPITLYRVSFFIYYLEDPLCIWSLMSPLFIWTSGIICLIQPFNINFHLTLWAFVILHSASEGIQPHLNLRDIPLLSNCQN